MEKYRFLIPILCVTFLTACNTKLGQIFSQAGYEGYKNNLENSAIGKSFAVERWLKEAANAKQNPQFLQAGQSVAGHFTPASVMAQAFAIQGKKGQRIAIDLVWNPLDTSARLFAELYKDQKRVASWEGGEFLHEFTDNRNLTLFIQPELLAYGSFSVSVSTKQTVSVFPVLGKDESAIQSFWGASRDGGSRKHEGVDIFAERGTPVVSPVKGRVSRVKTGGLGGKTVWVYDNRRGYNLYFAHLDTQMVSLGTGVKPGDTLGLVGNTGNAKYTPPHLHFGVYDGGAFDPLDYIKTNHPEVRAEKWSSTDELMMVTATQNNLRTGPSTKSDILETVGRNEVFQLLAKRGDWFYVKQIMNSMKGWLHQSLLSEISFTKESFDNQYIHIYGSADSLLWRGEEAFKVAKLSEEQKLLQSGAGELFEK